uniref:Uncharacterized protein n=1 Tax=Poecilia formosa TaxID=48698 RepID=A0A096LZQ6_POEFO
LGLAESCRQDDPVDLGKYLHAYINSTRSSFVKHTYIRILLILHQIYFKGCSNTPARSAE